MPWRIEQAHRFLAPHFRPAEPNPAVAGFYFHQNNFDALRLIFASMVVVYHIGILSQVSSLSYLHHWVSSAFAVQAFFVVSGFLVTMSYENSSSLKSYAQKRFRRIVPAYVVVVIGAALILSRLSSLPASEYFSNAGFWKYLGFNLLLSNFSAPNLPGVFLENSQSAVNGSLWTIKIEVAFYCFVPILVWAMRRFGAMRVLTILFFGSVIWKSGLEIAANSTNSYLLSKLSKQLPGQLSFFAGGAWAYCRTRDGQLPRGDLALAGVVAYAASFGVLHDIVAPAAVTAIVSWAALAAPRLPPVAKHGDFSYGIYLYHFPVVQTFVALGFFVAAPFASAVIIYLLVVLIAVTSWYLVEHPSMKKKSLSSTAGD